MNIQSLLVACAIAMPVASWAEPPTTGQIMPSVLVQDQHGQTWRITANTRLLLFAAGRKASNLAMEVLGQQPKGFLAARHALYLADMSKMPGFITRTFALPSLREQPFEVGVVLDEKRLTDWPRQEDAVTLIRLEAGRVVAVEYAASAESLRGALGLTP
ncbi:hypothetical protein [Hydrogenophaga sp.]|uniref:hypothetical protein n=1 Tax=Hydrogenophaga sp. TaxID=1904254 RepID=UPI0025BF5120|nr:hypothetical protein [Hydrogenophaga sp.]